METIIKQLPSLRDMAASMQDSLLADLVMIGEIPAPTFHEQARIEFIANRFSEAGLEQCTIDAAGNGSGLIRGTKGHQNILVTAHADTLPTEREDQTIEIHKDRLVGPFVGDNSIALATLTTLPYLLEKLPCRLKSNLIILASTKTLGRGNLEGLRSFIAGSAPFAAGICLESVQLGRLNYNCIGILRAEIHAKLPDTYKWEQYGTTGTIIPLSDVVNRISRIPLPRRPLTSIIMGSIHGGIAHNNIARESTLAFEVRSESLDILNETREKIEDITEEVAALSGIELRLDILTQRAPGGLDISHPLVRKGRAILTGLGIQPLLYASTSQLVALRDAAIPGVTLAITTGERKNELAEIEESVAIPPIATGLAQLAGLLLAIDEGVTP